MSSRRFGGLTVPKSSAAPRAQQNLQVSGSSSSSSPNVMNTTVPTTAGRPCRKRSKISRPGYVNTIEAVPSHEDDSSSEDDNKRRRKTMTTPRLPAPRVRRQTPMLSDDRTFVEETPEPAAGSSEKQICLTFNVPPGHTGPFVVNLPLDTLSIGKKSPTSTYSSTNATNSPGSSTSSLRNVACNSQRLLYSAEPASTGSSATMEDCKAQAAGFFRLPYELRSTIYRHLFIADGKLDFHYPTNFTLSGQLLSTCKAINSEGAPILYSENTFRLARQTQLRAMFWQPAWTEVGYKDVRLFLTMIKSNLCYLRDLELDFADATIREQRNRYTYNEVVKYDHDEVLLECLRLIGEHTQLQRLKLTFHGHILVAPNNTRFIHFLRRIKTDELDTPSPRAANLLMHYGNRVTPEVLAELKRRMVRAQPLYNTILPSRIAK